MNAILVYKERRALEFICGRQIMFSCGIGLGLSPSGPKTCEGDGKTPEGRYTVCTRNAQSKYTLFLGLNYPSIEDTQHAYDRQLITAAQLEAIIHAHKNGLRPPWDTPLGGEIGIHGGGIAHGGILCDNTAGCIALLDADIRFLWPLVSIGTPVTILP
jgi:murein L,D-transpeptidase YafK